MTQQYAVADRFLDQVQRETGEFMFSKIRMYLDMNYWIYMRQAITGNGSELQNQIFMLLKSLVQQGRVVCPISPHTWEELMRQSDRETRLATSEVIDELSRDCAFIDPLRIFRQELLHLVTVLLFEKKYRTGIDPVKYVWTKAPLMICEKYPFFTNADASEGAQVACAFLEYYSKFSMVDIIKQLPDNFPIRNDEKITFELNQGKDENQEWKSKKELFMIEVRGALEAVNEDVQQVCAHLEHDFQSGNLHSRLSNDLFSLQTLTSIIIRLFERNKIGTHLPSINIGARLHTEFRYDKQMRFQPTDLRDISHASWALPYCHYYFADRKFADLICNKAKLDRLYGTIVRWREGDVIDCLHQLQVGETN